MGGLLFAALADLRARTIPDKAGAIVAVGGLALAGTVGLLFTVQSVGAAAGLLILLVPLHARGVLGGGDVKLLAAAAVGQSVTGTLYLIEATALAGGVLALIHLFMRHLPRPALAPAGSSSLRRVYAAERWRILRGAPLPYGIAIACGGIWTILTHTWS